MLLLSNLQCSTLRGGLRLSYDDVKKPTRAQREHKHKHRGSCCSYTLGGNGVTILSALLINNPPLLGFSL